MRKPRTTAVLTVAALVCAGLAVAVGTASAGTPPTITVGVGKTVSYDGGPVVGNDDPLGQPAPVCETTQCDQEKVVLTAPAGYTAAHAINLAAKISFSSAGNTLDVGILDSSGALIASGSSVASGATVTAINLGPGTYTVEVDGDIAVTPVSFTMSMTATGTAKVVQPTAKVGDLTFSRETISDPFRLGSEPTIAVANDNKTVYESPIFGFSTTQSFLSRSNDGGETFKNLSFLPGIGKLDACPGGGDADLATDQYTGDIYMIDLGGAPVVPARVSSNEGQSFTSSCFANDTGGLSNAQAGANIFTDRQWLATDYINHREWFVYRDGVVNPGSTGDVAGPGTDVGKQAYGEYIKYAPLPTAAGTAGSAQLAFTGISTDAAGVAMPSNNDVSIAGNAIVDNGDAAHGGTSRYAGTLYVAEETATGVGVMIVRTAGGKSTFSQSIIPGNHHQILFPTVAVDRAGTIYEAWTDSTTNQVNVAESKNSGATWSTPIVINGAPAATTVMPWIVAGDAGRVDVVYYATANPASPTVNYGPWNVYLAQSLDANAAKPSFTQNVMTDRPNHIDPVCLSGLGCTVDTGPAGDRELGDFFRVIVDGTGRALVTFADGDNQLGSEVADGPVPDPSFGDFVRQATGPSLYVKTPTVTPIPVPSNSVSAADHTAPLPLQVPVTGAFGANAPSQVLRSSATSIGNDGDVHIRLSADDLSAALPVQVPPTITATYLTRWVYANHVYFASAEKTAGQWSFFAGQAAAVSDGDAIKYAAYPSGHAVTGSVTGNVINLSVPVTLVGSPARTATLYSVTTYALAASAPTPPNAQAAYIDVAAPTFPQVGDVLPAYNTERGGAAIPGVPGTGVAAIPPSLTTTPGHPTHGQTDLAFTGQSVWQSWLALALLVAGAGFGAGAVRARRRGEAR